MPAADYLNSMLVGYFDYAVLALAIGINILYINRYASNLLGCWPLLAIGVLFCLVLPVLSIWVELDRTQRPPGVPVDGFELLYAWFRFPMYWALFILQVSVLAICRSLQNQSGQSEPDLD
jgi:hypothetical protein